MKITMLHSKIHRATVTDANLNYVGSITIDRDIIDAADMLIGQKVDIVNVNNGERFTTYIIAGERGKKDFCLNGAAARKVHTGDKIIIMTYCKLKKGKAKKFKPQIIILNEDNEIEQEFKGLE